MPQRLGRRAVLEQGGRVLLRSRAVLDPGPSGGRVRGVAEQLPRYLLYKLAK